jgi:uncharacterized protein (TIGR02594 family)
MPEEYPWMDIARSKMGQAEIPGPPANPDIVEFLYSTTLDGPDKERDETPWCSAFVNWCIEQVGYQGTDSAWARSWLAWGQEADWNNLLPGAIVVLRRGENSGHVGFFVGSDDQSITLLGGNQGDRVCEASFPQSRILGIRIPA